MGEHLQAASATVEDIVAGMEAEGFAVVEGMLDDEEVRSTRAELGRVLEATPTGRNDFEGFATQRIYALFAKTRAFDEPAVHPRVGGGLERVLGGSDHFSPPVGRSIGPRAAAQVRHPDDQI
jgi:hypothetical protein